MKMNFLPRLLLTVIAFVPSVLASAQAADPAPEYQVVQRDTKNRWHFGKVVMPYLPDPWLMETPDFKIVEGKNTTAIDLRTAAPELAARAENVLYHLMQAKRYFVDVLKLESVKAQPQLTIRLNITNGFSNLGHFKNDALAPEYNNALSIAAGKGYAGAGIEPWGNEIWFRPKKEIPVKEFLNHLPSDPLTPTLKWLRSILYPMELKLGISNTLYALLYKSTPGSTTSAGSLWLSTMTRQAGTLILAEGAMQLSKLINRALIPNSWYSRPT